MAPQNNASLEKPVTPITPDPQRLMQLKMQLVYSKFPTQWRQSDAAEAENRPQMRNEHLTLFYNALYAYVVGVNAFDTQNKRPHRFPDTLIRALLGQWRTLYASPSRPVERGEWTVARQLLDQVGQGDLTPQQFGPSKSADIQIQYEEKIKPGLVSLKKQSADLAEAAKNEAAALIEWTAPPGGWALWGLGLVGLGVVTFAVMKGR